MFHLTAISVCVNYDDFLSITLPANIAHFDRVIVVTSENDQKTINLVEKHIREGNSKIKLLKTNIFYKNKALFNKGAAIREVQRTLIRTEGIEWICIIDADIVLPDNFRDICKRECKNKKVLYGAKRINYNTYNDFLLNKSAGETDINRGLGLGIGYLQVYHQNRREPKFYGTRYTTAAVSDMEFRKKWTTVKDLGVTVKHLGESWVNWEGRVTESFLKN